MKSIERKIHLIDAADKTIGRLATDISTKLRGKNKSDFDPSKDMGDIVHINNIKAIIFTGKKLEQKKYFRYSGYPGGLKTKKMSEVFKNDPAQILKSAVYEMLPPVRFRVNMMKRLIIK